MCSHRKLRQPEYFDTWITRILINECHNELRRQKRFRPLEELPETAVEEFDSLPLKEAMGRLPKKLAEAVTFSRSLTDAVENEYVQPLNLTQEEDGVTASVEYLIVDQKLMRNTTKK